MDFVNNVVDFDQYTAGDRVLDLLARDAAIDAGGKRRRLLVTIVNGSDGDSVRSSAILLENDDILRHVDQFTGHVARVSRFQSGVREALTSSVSGDEILQHCEAFTEVRNDRTFDDFAGGLGHQSAHTAELFDLRFVTTGTGIDHHEERRCLFLAFVELDLAIERVGDGVGGLSPDVDDFLIALTVGDDTVAILLGDFFDFLVGLGDDFWLFLGDDHVDDSDRSSRAGCFAETEIFQFV